MATLAWPCRRSNRLHAHASVGTALRKRVLAALVGVVAGILLPECLGDAQAVTRAEDLLVIYSPHSRAIRDEFTWAFEDYWREKTGRQVEIRWPDAGGSSGILRQLKDKQQQNIHDVDIVFGGGPIHDDLKQSGILQPYRLPDDLLAALPETVAGEPLYDPEFFWYGAAISTFGLVYNERLIAERHLPPVTEWTDMTRPEFLGLVGAVDASQSGSVRKAYEIILQAYGYERGMRVLALMSANARDIGRSASEIPRDCAQGFIAVGPCIDFYAWRQMLTPGGKDLGFALPEGLTVVNTDPISILAGAPHLEAAREFVNFVMSLRGQLLWSLRKGTPGGPREETLGRYAVLPAVYEDHAADLMQGLKNPLGAPPNRGYSLAKERARIGILPVYLRAMAITNKRLLTEAWRTVIDAGAPEDLVAELTVPLVSEDEMLRLAHDVWDRVRIDEKSPDGEKDRLLVEQDRRMRARSDLVLQWTEAFRSRYEAVAEKARARRGE